MLGIYQQVCEFNSDFYNDITLSFREQHKQEFYAYCYGNYKAEQQFADFFFMLTAGYPI